MNNNSNNQTDDEDTLLSSTGTLVMHHYNVNTVLQSSTLNKKLDTNYFHVPISHLGDRYTMILHENLLKTL